MRVSVALATHNGVQHIDEQLVSIFAQSHPVDEIVISDDDSSDGTGEIVAARLSAAANMGMSIRMIENSPRLGVALNFFRAIRESDGDVIFLADQDDVWHPDRVARMTDLLRNDTQALLVHTDARLVDSQGDSLKSTLFDALGMDRGERSALINGDAFGTLLRRNLVTGATVAIRRELLGLASPFPDSWLHDEWLAIIAAANGGLRCMPEPTIDYRQHATNQIGVNRLTLRGAVARLREPRTKRNARLLARADALVEWLATVADSTPPRDLARAREKLDHERFRSALPASRSRRFLPLAAEVRRGGYRDYGRGWPDVLRDLLQPESSDRAARPTN